jgi:hypothetical protein
MAGNTPETFITPQDLHIGAADTGHKHADERLILAGFRPARIRLESERAVKEKGFHRRVYVTTPSFHHATKKADTKKAGEKAHGREGPVRRRSPSSPGQKRDRQRQGGAINP